MKCWFVRELKGGRKEKKERIFLKFIFHKLVKAKKITDTEEPLRQWRFRNSK